MTSTTSRLDKVEAALAPPSEDDLEALIAEVAAEFALPTTWVREQAQRLAAGGGAARRPGGGLDLQRVAEDIAAEFALPVATVLADAERIVAEGEQRARGRGRGRRR